MSWLFRNRLTDDPGVRPETRHRIDDLPDDLQQMIFTPWVRNELVGGRDYMVQFPFWHDRTMRNLMLTHPPDRPDPLDPLRQIAARGGPPYYDVAAVAIAGAGLGVAYNMYSRYTHASEQTATQSRKAESLQSYDASLQANMDRNPYWQEAQIRERSDFHREQNYRSSGAESLQSYDQTLQANLVGLPVYHEMQIKRYTHQPGTSVRLSDDNFVTRFRDDYLKSTRAHGRAAE